MNDVRFAAADDDVDVCIRIRITSATWSSVAEITPGIASRRSSSRGYTDVRRSGVWPFMVGSIVEQNKYRAG